MQPTDVLKTKKRLEKEKSVYPALVKKLDEIIRANNGYLAAGKVRIGTSELIVRGKNDNVIKS